MTQNSIYSENVILLLTINKFKEYLFLTNLKRVSGPEHPFLYFSALPDRTGCANTEYPNHTTVFRDNIPSTS